jgi:uncharacterized protein
MNLALSAAPAPNTAVTHLARDERVVALDALRGIALLGILFVNFSFFAMPDGAFGTYISSAFPMWWDRAAQFFIDALCDGKFILIFSFLFGWGFHTQLSGGGAPLATARYRRRLIGLLCIGLAHAALLFIGDILVTYALLGIPLYFIRRWSSKRLVTLAVASWLASVVGHLLLGVAFSQAGVVVDTTKEALQVHIDGSFVDIMRFRLQALAGYYLITPLLFMPQVFGMFLIGLAAAREHHAHGMTRLQHVAALLLPALLIPALIGNVAYAWLNSQPSARTDALASLMSIGARGLFAPMLSIVYLSVAARALTAQRSATVVRWMSGEGRSTLSLYIGESVVMGLIFNGYGLGMYGRIGPAAGIAICLAVYALLLVLMQRWMKHFRLGPLEWVLRSVTEWKLLPIRAVTPVLR